MSDWLSFWNSPNRIYVNELHRDVHYRDVALQIRSFVPSNTATVIDYGCGESIHADLVAQAAGKLTLSDGADSVREFLANRFAHVPNMSVQSPAEIAALPPGSVDLIVLNSVSQYLKQPELEALLATFRKLLAPTGTLVVGDVLPPHTNALTEVGALMKLAYANGFVLAAFGGLARTLFSEYRKLRSSLGLTHHTEEAMLATLTRAGFTAQRRYPNIEHNQQRMTFVARLA